MSSGTKRTEEQSASSSEKKQKTDPPPPLQDLSKFELERVIFVDKGIINVVGTFAGSPDKAVVLFSRDRLDESDTIPLLQSCKLTREQQNTYYGFYKATQECPRRFAVTVIHPCQEWHITKYSKQERVLFRETPDLYEKVTKPYMASHPASEIKWLYALLDKTAEQDRLLFEDAAPATGFLMYAFKPVAEVKTDDPSHFKALVMCNRRDLQSLRELRADSIPLLKNIRDKVTTYLSEELKILPNKFRMFFHYKPTYFHLHVHVAHIEHDMHVGLKDYSLDDVIEHLEMDSDYFAHKTMSFAVGVEDKLYKAFLEHTEGNVAMPM